MIYFKEKRWYTRIYIYLLDKYLEIGEIGMFSTSIVEMVLKEVVEKSYRKTAETIKNLTNLSITHNAARNIVLDVVKKKIRPLEEEKIDLYEKGYIEGTREKNIIFEESDGIFIAK